MRVHQGSKSDLPVSTGHWNIFTVAVLVLGGMALEE